MVDSGESVAKRAEAHLGESGPTNTCVSNGMNRWPQEAGLGGIDTASVTRARELAKAGHNGWTYHEGMSGVRRGDFVDWAGIFHVSCVTDVSSAGIATIGSGGPTGLVARQPRTGGHNPRSAFRGYFRPPAKRPGPKGKTPPHPGTHRVVDGDTLSAIAESAGVTVAAIVKANPSKVKGPNKDRIYAGDLLVIPKK